MTSRAARMRAMTHPESECVDDFLVRGVMLWVVL